jgi:hypothetical protein
MTVAERITLGKLAFTLQDGALRHLSYDGVELIRGLSFLVRDRDWGTLAPRLTTLSREEGDVFRQTIRAEYQTTDARLSTVLTIEAGEGGVAFAAKGEIDGPFETNRTGFTILHPASVAGCPAVIVHSDDTVDEGAFPTLIDPWQPFMDIVSITHDREGYRVSCEMCGDTFEMEDQRQWGDASYKTYNRPLAKPWPYVLPSGEVVEQSVHVSWEKVETVSTAVASDQSQTATFPETAIVLTAEDARRLAVSPQDINAVMPQRLLCHIDAALGDIAGQVAAFGQLQTALPNLTYDVELICLFEPSVEAELKRFKAEMAAVGFAPDSVLICPSVDRQSTPPGSAWPECPPLEDIHKIAADVFFDVARGGGMVSFFPELNRKRPPLDHLVFVSHGLCPIVHAADDLSVMETLETIPHITRSARAIIGKCEYRLGPSTIAMRQNPYGTRTIPNPNGERVCMTDDDPRHRGQFGAAYTLGVATMIADADVQVWTPSALYGPRGLEGPIVEVIAALARCAGESVRHASLDNGIATLQLGSTRFRANVTGQSNGGLPPYGWDQTSLADQV